MFVYAFTIFSGAFLLFLVQPLIGKYILPWFGGAPAVWTTCMLFFQLLLLAGYAYAHCSARWLKPRAQAAVHLVLLAAAMALLGHVTPAESWKPADGSDPTLRILGLLLASIGLPYFVLAATSPLMQHWFSRTNPGVSPFRLYALSNVGSLLALAGFPAYFEPHFTRPVLAHLWGAGLVLFGVSCGLCAWKLVQFRPVEAPVPAKTKTAPAESAAPAAGQKILWLLLPACASTLLLATTNMMCQEVAVIPFLWVLPLALYLLSFIICFDSPRWYVRWLFTLLFFAAMCGILWALFAGAEGSSIVQLGIYSAGLFICCMVCHGEVYRLRPAPEHLTEFYLMIAGGGALGGIFVAVLAPLIFKDYYELHWGLFACGLLFLAACRRNSNPVFQIRRPAGQKVVKRGQVQRKAEQAVLAAGVLALGLALVKQAGSTAKIDAIRNTHPTARLKIERSRNFYGVLTVFTFDDDVSNMHYVQLSHGRTLHGQQFTDRERSRWPTTYYNENSGVGMLLRALPGENRRIGLIGLGGGTLAAYPKAGDVMRIYEINPEVLRIANTNFIYLAQCHGKVEVVLGDARLSMEKEPPQNYDLFILDAFNSDAIPVHLLTREAFAIYERHLKPNGMIAMHISNKNLNLDAVIAKLAEEFHYKLVVVDSPAPADKPWLMSASWALLARDPEGEKLLDRPEIQLVSRPPLTNVISMPLWTDDYASLFQIFKSYTPAQIDPAFTYAQCQAAFTLYQRGDMAGAITQIRTALKTLPRSPTLLSNLAFLLATCPDATLRNLPEATQLAEKACQLTHYHEPDQLTTLGAVYSETGRYPEAIHMAEKVVALATESGQKELVQKNEELLKFYRANRPFHDSTTP